MVKPVETYVSEPEVDTSVDEREPPKKRAKKRTRNWELCMEIEEGEGAATAHTTAVKYIMDSGEFSYTFSNDLKKGRKDYYRCNFAKSRGQQCDAGFYVFLPHSDHTAKIYKDSAGHSHEELTNRVSVSKKDKEILKTLFKAGDDSERIWESHGKKVLQNRRQLTNIMATFRTEEYGPTQISVDELQNWCSAHGKIPKDENELFVLDTHIEEDGSTVRVLVSTKKLLEMSTQSEIVHADGTYKLMWQGFPVIVVGTTDARRKFVLTAFAISTGETTGDYEFVFRGLQQAYTVLKLSYDFK